MSKEHDHSHHKHVQHKKGCCPDIFPWYGDINRWTPPLQYLINGREVVDYKKYRIKNKFCATYCCKYLFISKFKSAWFVSIFFVIAVISFLRKQIHEIGTVTRVADSFEEFIPWIPRGDDFCEIMAEIGEYKGEYGDDDPHVYNEETAHCLDGKDVSPVTKKAKAPDTIKEQWEYYGYDHSLMDVSIKLDNCDFEVYFDTTSGKTPTEENHGLGGRLKLNKTEDDHEEGHCKHFVSNEMAMQMFLEDHNFLEFKSHFDWNTYGYIKIEIEHAEDPEIFYDGSLTFLTYALTINHNYEADLTHWWREPDDHSQHVYEKQQRMYWWTRGCSKYDDNCPLDVDHSQSLFPFVRHYIKGPAPW